MSDSSTDIPSYRERRPELGPRKWYQTAWFYAALAGIITIPLLRPCLRHVPDPPPVIAELPDFELVDQDGRAFGSDELRGKVFIANTFFTSCRSVCPPLMRAMGELQTRVEREEELRDEPLDIRLVSITVDPHNDTPERLREYAAEFGVDFDRWTLLTGDEADIRALVIGGFLTAMGEEGVDPQNANLIHISHSARFVLVDSFGRIRGSSTGGHFGSDEMGIDEVFHRSLHVLDARDDEAEELQTSRGES